jgi:WD40 repeat protein
MNMRIRVYLLVTLFLWVFGIARAVDQPSGVLSWNKDGQTLALGGRIGDQATIWLFDSLDGAIREIQVPATATLGLAWSPNGQQIAHRSNLWSGEDQVLILDLTQSDQSPIITLTEGPSTYNLIQWSPDGRYIAMNGGLWLNVIDANTGNIVARYYDQARTGNRSIQAIEWSADSQSIYVLYENFSLPQAIPEALYRWTISSNQITWIASLDPEQYYLGMAINQDRSLLAVADDEGVIRVLDLLDPSHSVVYLSSDFRDDNQDILQSFWLPGSNHITVMLNGLIIKTWNLDTNEIATIATIPDMQLMDAALSPAGGRLAMSVFTLDDNPAANLSADSAIYQSFLDNALQIVVPDSSPQYLEAITAACGLPARTEAALDQQAATDLTAFTAQVAALPDTQIPPGCRADLLAVAAALQAQ